MKRITLAASLLVFAACGGAEKAPEAAPAPAEPTVAAPAPDSAAMKAAADSAAKAAPAAEKKTP